MAKPTHEPTDAKDKTPLTRPADKPSRSIRVDPPELTRTVLLGGEHRAKYSVDNLKAGARVAWHHTVVGGGKPQNIEHTGSTSTVTEMVSTAGEREIDTTAEVDGHRESAATATLVTPKTTTNIVGLWGDRRERGRTPLAHTMQADETLVVQVELPKVDASINEANSLFYGDGFEAQRTQTLGPRKFEAVLRPTVGPPGKVSGSLFVIPKGVSATAVTPVPINMDIEQKSTDRDDYGERPGTTQTAINDVLRAWTTVYGERIDAVDALMKQTEAVDPLPIKFMEKVGLGIASLAITAATAGIGAGLASKVFSGIDGSFAQGVQELSKVLVEGTAASAIEKSLEGLAERSKEAQPTTDGHGLVLSPELFFAMCQHEALTSERDKHLRRVDSRLSSTATRLDREKPGDGYRYAVSIYEKIKAPDKTPFKTQFHESLQAWCTFNARLRLGTGERFGRDKGTELITQVDPQKILGHGGGTNFWNRDLHKTPGVLRVELEETSPGQFSVARSFIAGITSNDAVTNLRGKLKTLKIPVVARFVEKHKQRAFVVSRNENGVVIGESTHGLLQDIFGGETDHEAARLVVQQINEQVVSPERG